MNSRPPRRTALVLLCVLAVLSTSATAWSISSLFGEKDESGDENLSDGTDTGVTQPLLKATDWFITEEEIVASRGGIPRKGLQTYTSGNQVSAYTATNEFFSAVLRDFQATKEGDRVMINTWNTCNIPFEPNSSARTTVDVLFQEMVNRGTNINVLGWTNHLYPTENIKTRNAVNSVTPSQINHAKALYIFDDRTPLLLSSHHQKAIIIAANESHLADEFPVAYVGGIDPACDRWDTINHNNAILRKAANITRNYDGWVDAHFRIHGPAAKDVASNFLDRWNSDYKPALGLDDKVQGFENPDYDKLPPIKYASSNTTSNLGKQNVQIVRTFSCNYMHYDEFAPRGEQSLFRARIKALKNARNFIYVEDQYFILVPELLDALMEVLPRIQRLIVVLSPPASTAKAAGYDKYLYEMIHPIKRKFPNKVQIYITKKERKIYVHTKLVIIDDVYVSLGSANWNRRSMTSDSELNANVIDEETVQSPDGITVLKLARDMRIRKFVEMTGRSYEELDAMKFTDAADQFKLAAQTKSTILAGYGVEYEVHFVAFIDEVRKNVDPQEVCNFPESGSAVRSII